METQLLALGSSVNVLQLHSFIAPGTEQSVDIHWKGDNLLHSTLMGNDVAIIIFGEEYTALITL